MYSKKDVAVYIESKKDLFVDVNDKIWAYAELAYTEKKSSKLLNKILEQDGFTVEIGVGGIATALIASYGQGEPTIAVLGEYDALPGLSQAKAVAHKKEIEKGGNGHGCGHNSLGVGALAACFGAKKYLAETGVSGTIKFFGCPAEEHGDGKLFMIRAGLFNEVDAAISWHSGTLNSIISNPTMAVLSTSFRFFGRSAHAAFDPHSGRSALDAVELMNVGCNYLREHIIPDARIHYAITDSGGTAANVVPAEAEVNYMVRGPMISMAKDVYERVCDVARGAALMTGTRLEIRYQGGLSHYLPNRVLDEVLHANMVAIGPPKFDQADEAFAKEITRTLTKDDFKTELDQLIRRGLPQEQARELMADKVLADFIVPYRPLDMVHPGSSDMGDVSLVVPTTALNGATLALGTPGHSWQTVSQSASSIAHKGVLFAGKVMAGTAIDFFDKPEIVEKAKVRHLADMAGSTYVCPLPEGAAPGKKRN